MKRIVLLGIVVGLGLGAKAAIAQVTADGTLSTTVTQTGNNFAIDNGDRVGSNLFHSFGQFSVPTGGAAIFNNAVDVQNIFSRVTGGSISNIDGLIQANGTANLFLLNPSGILFGPNASLNIGGSFIGTTANSIRFADGVEFSAVNPTAPPLLTMSVPIGLQMGQNPGAIQMQGSGYLLTSPDPTFAPYIQTGLHPGLAVSSGKTLALVGGAIELQGGVLTAPGGRVELGSVSAPGLVSLTAVPQGFQLSYGGVQGFGEVRLGARSLADASGTIAGAIQVQGGQVILEGGSHLWIQNRGLQRSGDLRVFATESLTVSGTTADGRLRTSLVTETVAPGATGDLVISTPRLQVEAGGGIGNKVFSGATGGNITLQSAQIEINGFAAGAPGIFSAVSTLTGGTGRSGDVSVTTQQLSVLQGGFLGSATIGSGTGGDVVVQADTVRVSGTTASLISSNLAAASLGPGNAGSLALTTRTLAIWDSGLVSTSSLGTGSAGTLFVQASESVEIRGRVSAQAYPSSISSVGSVPNAGLNQLGVNTSASTTAGDVTVNTPRLTVSDRGAISVANDQSNSAGTLQINATSVLLDREGTILASTLGGEGGNINIQTQILQLRHGSSIIATAVGGGNGGNIVIQSPIILGLENSDIIANAFQGRGGNILITTQGIFGLQYRLRLTPENDITASSELGVNGNVDIFIPGVDPNAGLVELPVSLANPSQQVAQGCAANPGSSFVITGRGGIPLNPTTQMGSDRPWTDTRDLSTYRSQRVTHPPQASIPAPLVEATGWRRNAKGDVEVYAATAPSSAAMAVTCAPWTP